MLSMVGNVLIFYRTWFKGRYAGLSSFIERRFVGNVGTFFETDGLLDIQLTDIPVDVSREVFKNPLLYEFEPIPSFVFLSPTAIGIEDSSAFHFAGVVAVNAGDAVILGWGKEGLENYENIAIYRSGEFGILGGKVASVPTSELGWRDGTADPNTTYFYTLRGMRSDGSEDAFTYQYPGRFTDLDVPPLPTNVRAREVTPHEVVISWKNPAVSDFAFARVYRSTIPGAAGTLVSDFVRVEEYHDTDVEPGGEYFYTVTAVDTSFNESYSRVTPALFRSVFPSTAAEETATLLSLTDVNITNLEQDEALLISWGEVQDSRIGKVRVYRSDSFERIGSVIGEIPKPFIGLVDATVIPNERYYYTLRPVDTLGRESPLEVRRVGVFRDTTPPGNPRNVALIERTPGSVTISWDPPPDRDVVSYRVYRSARPAEAGYLVASGLTRTAFDDTFSSKVTYHYAVSAVDSAGNESQKPLPYAIQRGRIPFTPFTVSTSTPQL